MTRAILTILSALLATSFAAAADKTDGKPNTLTSQETSDGWILLFDGDTTFGWKTDGDARVADGTLLFGGDKPASIQTTTVFSAFELQFQYRAEKAGEITLVLNSEDYALESPGSGASKDWTQAAWKVESTDNTHQVSASFVRGEDGKPLANRNPVRKPGLSRTTIGVRLPAGGKLAIRNVKLKPLAAKAIFNGKDLNGWKEVADRKSRFTVTDKGEINVKDGNGELQTEGQWDDFILQLDIISNGKHLNSGILFRCLPGEFWQGYESQIRNQWQGDDRTKPVDFGTGGLYNRQPARKVVSSDAEWFTKTVVAHDNHFAIWINGYQTCDFTDTKPIARSARQGCRLDKGAISIQGHDPTTDLSFRNIRVAEIPKAAKVK